MEQQPAHTDSQSGGSPATRAIAQQRPHVAIVIATIMALGGGWVCGWMLDQFGEFGAIGFSVLGVASGKLHKRFGVPSLTNALILVAGCVLAFVIAEVFWIQWNIEDAENFGKALSLFPSFLQQFRQSAFVAAILLFFGASSAYVAAR